MATKKNAGKSGRNSNPKRPRRAKSRPAPQPSANNRPGLIVGLGVSARGLDAFQRFFHAMPTDSGMAFVVIAHLDPKLKSALSDLLARASTMPVQTVTQVVDIAPNRVYVIAPDSMLRVKGGQLV